MKNLLQLLTITALLSGMLFAQITPISNIQDVTGAGSDESPLVGQVVTIEGIISAESGAYGSSYYVQDAEAKWSGIMVYDSDHPNTYGMKVRVTGTVAEYYGLTELTDVTEFVVVDSNRVEVNPLTVTTGEIGTGSDEAEAYEGVLVKIVDANITSPENDYGEWKVDDGTGEVMIDDEADYYFTPSKYSSVKSVVGPLSYSYDEYRIYPRGAWDIIEEGPYTRIQRVQQVRYSDLERAFLDAASDTSYLCGDTITVTGIVTMPTGLSYAGAGIKFIFQEEGGGPWSSVLSYNRDSTAYPQLYEGDLIEMTGYIDEYTTGSANMTEFFITSPIQILNFGLDTPPVDTVKTGDLIKPVTAEQWGNNIICVKEAVVTDVDPGYELFEIDDGSGPVLVDDDSDSLVGFVDPPLGAIFATVEGWLYHHYGAYETEDTYKICPFYPEDLVYGGGPPTLTDMVRDPMIPSSTDVVNVSLNVATNGSIDEVRLKYRVNGGSFITRPMTDNGEGVYTGQIFENEDGAWVEYLIEAVDTEEQYSSMPADTSKKMFGYTVTDGELSIADIQYSPWETADSPLDQAYVTLTGIVTVDTSFKNTYGAYVMQDESNPWSGITLFGIDEVLTRGDEITVYGKVEEYNEDYHYKWDNNTQILVDSVKVLSQGQTLPAALSVTTGELAENPEMYEGVLVEVSNAQVTSINQYDWSLDDGSGECLIDDDASRMSDWFGDLAVGDVLNRGTGIFIYSFGTYKIEVRNLDDVSKGNAVDNPIEIARSYKLEQNFPNPFNPETRIYFEIPETKNVTLVIYNVLGQKIRTLANRNFGVGKHTLNWDGKNDFGVPAPTGTYIYRMKAGDFISTKKMVLMK